MWMRTILDKSEKRKKKKKKKKNKKKIKMRELKNGGKDYKKKIRTILELIIVSQKRLSAHGVCASTINKQ